MDMPLSAKRNIRRAVARSRFYLKKRVAPGWRLPTGVLLMVGGVFGFLPILGFWMIPLGIGLAALDVKDMRQGKLGLRRPFARRSETPDDSKPTDRRT